MHSKKKHGSLVQQKEMEPKAAAAAAMPKRKNPPSHAVQSYSLNRSACKILGYQPDKKRSKKIMDVLGMDALGANFSQTTIDDPNVLYCPSASVTPSIIKEALKTAKVVIKKQDIRIKELEESSRYNSKYELHDEEESKNEEKDDYKDDGSSEGGGVPCAAPSDVMNTDIMIDPPKSNRASPGASIFTCLSSPSPERVSIYDNWPSKECYTVREADIPQETRELQLVRRLNGLKDLPKSKEIIKQMKRYSAELKESKMNHEGPHDKLDQMFVPKRGSHRLKSTNQGNGTGAQAIPINTNIDCPGQRPSIKAMVDYAESMDGTILETGVIFRDVSKRFYINKSMSRIGDNCRWIVSTEGDCLFAFNLHGKMWIKIYDTVRTANPNADENYVRV